MVIIRTRARPRRRPRRVRPGPRRRAGGFAVQAGVEDSLVLAQLYVALAPVLAPVGGASAACRSVRFSANCNAVTNASRAGDQPGRPRTPNAAANCSSVNSSPNSSRITTGNGARRPRYILRTAAAISSDGSGHGCGCTDIKTQLYGRERETTAKRSCANCHKPDRHHAGAGPSINQQGSPVATNASLTTSDRAGHPALPASRSS